MCILITITSVYFCLIGRFDIAVLMATACPAIHYGFKMWIGSSHDA